MGFLLFLLFAFLSACTAAASGLFLPTEACKRPDPDNPSLSYNLWPLQRNEGSNDRVTYGANNITLLFNLCGSLVDETNMYGCNRDASACIVRQQSTPSHGGSATTTTRLQVVERKHVRYALSEGETCPEDTKQKQRVQVDLFCDPDRGRGTPLMHDIIDSCLFVVHWTTAYACPSDGKDMPPPQQPGRKDGPHQTKGGASEGPSGWAIFFWIVFSLILAYFVLGIAYKRVVMGQRGWDQLPHADFWLSLWSRLPIGSRHQYRIRL